MITSIDDFLDRFAVYIISYKRPDRVKTLNMLERYGYTGRYFIVVDDGDPTLPEYQKRYGDILRIYNKADIVNRYDRMDNFGPDTWKSAWFPRNPVNEIAQQDDLEFYCVLDDDYRNIQLRFIVKNNICYYLRHAPSDTSLLYSRFLDHLFYILSGLFSLSPHIMGVGIAQAGDFVMAKDGPFGKKYTWHRKLMNFFVLSTDRPVEFIGRLNEDVNTYVYYTLRGKIFLTIPLFALIQELTQQNPGGVTETYIREGTYIKSFYSVMISPAGVRIWLMPTSHPRIHHKVLWRHVAPRIISERWRKIGR